MGTATMVRNNFQTCADICRMCADECRRMASM
jgi:hypothetical protein